MKIVTAKQMRELDEQTIRSGISGDSLMERAGVGSFAEIQLFLNQLGPRHVKHAIILAGKGNNGGDGYVIARHLAENLKVNVSVYSVCPINNLKGDALRNAVRLPANVGFRVCHNLPPKCFKEGTLFIDCLLGTGITGLVKEPYSTLIQEVNDGNLPVISIDVPSGVNADNGTIENGAIQADLTITIGLPKIGLLLGAGMEHSGQLRLVEIGILPNLIQEIQSPFDAVFHQDIRTYYKRIPKQYHKAKFGKILIIGGSEKFPGAPMLAGRGALRAGGGLVTVAYPKSIGSIMHPQENALILRPLEDQGYGYHKTQKSDILSNLISDKDVVVLGPGLARHTESMNLVQQLISTHKTLVLDADGLYVFMNNHNVLPREGLTVLTPHPGEMKRLISALNLHPLATADRITQARSIAARLKAFIVLKGPATVIASPEGEVAINTSGSPALATGGTGDVLAGMIAAHICQFPDLMQALKSAVFIHGRAAELAPNGMRSFIADNILATLGVALQDVTPFA